jgi:ribosomal protein L39E
MHGITSITKHIDNEHEAIVAKYALHNRMKTKFPVWVMRRVRSANKLHLLQRLWRSKFASKKIEDPCENQVCFKSYTFPRDIGVCPCHHNLLQSSIFAFTCLCFI